MRSVSRLGRALRIAGALGAAAALTLLARGPQRELQAREGAGAPGYWQVMAPERGRDANRDTDRKRSSAHGSSPGRGLGGDRDLERTAARIVEIMRLDDLDLNDSDDEALEELREDILRLLRDPVDPNTAGRRRLAEIPLLDPSHVEALLRHRAQDGPRIASWRDMTAIAGFEPDHPDLVRPFFTFAGDRSPGGAVVTWSESAARTLQRLEGHRAHPDEGGYVGDPWRTDLRLEATASRWEAGWKGWKREGEPLADLQRPQRRSHHLRIANEANTLEVRFGDFRMGTGGGMVLGSGASNGRSIARLGSGAGHRSALGADPDTRLRGLAVSIGRQEGFRADIHLARQERAGSVDEQGLVRPSAGGRRHATLAERQSREVVLESRAGVRVSGGAKGWNVGVAALASSFDRAVKVGEDPAGRAIARPGGRLQLDMGLDASGVWRPPASNSWIGMGWAGADLAGRFAEERVAPAGAGGNAIGSAGWQWGAVTLGGGIGLSGGASMAASWHARAAGFRPIRDRAPGRFDAGGREQVATLAFSTPFASRSGGGFRLKTALHRALDPTQQAARPLGMWDVEGAIWMAGERNARTELRFSHRNGDRTSVREDWLGRPVEGVDHRARSAATLSIDLRPSSGEDPASAGSFTLQTRLSLVRAALKVGDPLAGRPPGVPLDQPKSGLAPPSDDAATWGMGLTQRVQWQATRWMQLEARWTWHASPDSDTALRIGRIPVPGSFSTVYLGGEGVHRSAMIRLSDAARGGRLSLWLRYDAHHVPGTHAAGSGPNAVRGSVRQTLHIQLAGSAFGQ